MLLLVTLSLIKVDCRAIPILIFVFQFFFQNVSSYSPTATPSAPQPQFLFGSPTAAPPPAAYPPAQPCAASAVNTGFPQHPQQQAPVVTPTANPPQGYQMPQNAPWTYPPAQY